MSIDALSANLVSDLIIAIVVWAFATSVKSWVTKLIDEQTLKIQAALESV